MMSTVVVNKDSFSFSGITGIHQPKGQSHLYDIFNKALMQDDVETVKRCLDAGLEINQNIQVPSSAAEVFFQESELKRACLYHSIRVLPCVTPSWMSSLVGDSFLNVYLLGTALLIQKEPPVEPARIAASRQLFSALISESDPAKKSANAMEFIKPWFGTVDAAGLWSETQKFCEVAHHESIRHALAIYGFSQPKNFMDVRTILAPLGITEAVDPCAGSGFIAACLQHFSQITTTAFDLKKSDNTLIGRFYPVKGETNACLIDYSKYDWKKTLLVLSWPDQPNHPVISLPVIQKVKEAGGKYLLILGSRIGEAYSQETTMQLIKDTTLLYRALLPTKNIAGFCYQTLELLELTN